MTSRTAARLFLLLARVAIAVALGACRSNTLPPGPEDPAANLALLDRFAGSAEASGLETSWTIAVEPGKRLRASTPGLVPLLWLEPQEIQALHDRLETPEDLHLLELVADRAIELQLVSGPGPAAVAESIRRIRAHQGMGDGTERDRILAEEPDPAAREAAWSASAATAAELAPLVRDLVRARNRWARSRFDHPFLHVLREHRGYDPGGAASRRAEVFAALVPKAGEPLISPWDGESMDPALIARLGRQLDGERCLERAREVLAWAGLPTAPAALNVLIRSGGVGGFAGASSYPVDPPRDLRVVVAPGPGLFAHWTTLHEFGHAAQALAAPATGPELFRRTASPAVAESCGKIAERLVYAPEWLRRQGVAESDIVALAEWERASEIWRMRRILADTAFEEAIYHDPEADLDRTYVELQERVGGTRVQDTASPWALEKNLVFKPLARIDYLLARCAQAAIYRRLRALPGGLLGAAATTVLREDVLETAPGQRFDAWFERAAGEPPSCRAWLEDVARVGVR